MNTLSDNALMLRVQAGDVDKMGLLFERYHRQLYGFLFHMTYQREASEDMVQLVFYKMLKYNQSFTGSGEFIHWMYSVARNVLKDHAAKNKKYTQNERIEDHTEKIAGGMAPDEHFERKQAKAALYKAMDKLSKDHREVLTMSRFQELRHQEIAVILNISEVAVKTRVHRALHELKNIYAKDKTLKTGLR